MPEHVTLRAAAKALGISPGTLSPLLHQQPTLAAAVVGTGPRRSLQIDLDVLKAAWFKLQPSDDDDDAPDDSTGRRRYHFQRRLRLWWQLCAERAVLADEDAVLAVAAELAEREPHRQAALRQAAADWLDQAVAEVPGQQQEEARQVLLRLTTATLQQLASRANGDGCPPPPPPNITPPTPLPSLWDLRAGLEEVRGERERLHLQVKRGELLPVDQVQDRFSAQALQIRDAWLQLGETLALRSRHLATAESFKTLAATELSRLGLI